MTADPEKIMAMAMQMMEKVDAQMVRFIYHHATTQWLPF